jgi:hypothetical protein
MVKMEDWEKRIHEILGEKSGRSKENCRRYFSFLERTLNFPVRVTGREDFEWEEPYVIGGWSQTEYARLKKTKASYTDEFELLSLFSPIGRDDIDARVRRLSDDKEFVLGLSWLVEVDPENWTRGIIKKIIPKERIQSWHAHVVHSPQSSRPGWPWTP